MGTRHTLLGDWAFSWKPFDQIDETFQKFSSTQFRMQETKKRFNDVNTALLSFIQKHKTPCFLLPQVLDFIQRVNAKELLNEPYSLSLFEFWLNVFSKLGIEDNLLVRGKIAGRYIPRDEYQCFFPVGLGKTLSGSHFVAAHLSPDVDTAVASFWGWLDSFACRLTDAIHYWSLPKGLSDGHIQHFFKKNFGESFFTEIARSNAALSLTAMDLLSQKNLVKIPITLHSDAVSHGDGDVAVLVVDKEGMYIDEWRSQDTEATRQVVDTFIAVIRWFKNTILVHLIESLAKEPANLQEAKTSLETLFQSTLQESEIIQEMDDRQKKLLHTYTQKCLSLPNALQHTFDDLFRAIDRLFSHSFDPIFQLFAVSDKKEDRISHTEAMQWLEKVVATFEGCLRNIRNNLKTVSHLLDVKRGVLEYSTPFVTLKSTVEEMRLKIGSFDHLTVVVPEGEKGVFPVGIVRARDLQKTVLGTASLRDFSTFEETHAAPYIDIVSIIDHHKTNIKTAAVSTLLLADAQSTNTLLSECSLQINKAFHSASPYWVSTERELLEYFSQIYAILDDTDLLNKVSKRDLNALIGMLNRMLFLLNNHEIPSIPISKPISSYQEVKKAAQQLLQNRDLHSIYKTVYHYKEQEIEETLVRAGKRQPSSFFSDSKTQNGCCRLGQTKIFAVNLERFSSLYENLKAYWLDESILLHTQDPNIDFFLHMISTIPGEKEVMQGGPSWQHEDEFWIWVPEEELALQHLSTFLTNFNYSDTAQNVSIDAFIEGKNTKELYRIVSQNTTKARALHVRTNENPHTVIILRFPAGSINSRKTQVTPYLPKSIL